MIKELLDILLPRRCGVCGGKLIAAEKCLCTACSMRMPLTYFWTMESNAMSEALNARIQKLRDASSVTFYEPYSYACALYFYKEGYRNISKALKYKGDMPLGRYVSSALGRKIASSPYFADVDIIMPVPLHWTRRAKRGYNQAYVIASSIALEMAAAVSAHSAASAASAAMSAPSAPSAASASMSAEHALSATSLPSVQPLPESAPKLAAGIITRARRTRSQATLAVSDKAANVSGAFRVDAAALERLVPGDGSRHHILLVDDVFTTGSTLSECQHALRTAIVKCMGPEMSKNTRISCACLSYVGE